MRRSVPALALALLCAACGSTAQVNGVLPLGSSDGLGAPGALPSAAAVPSTSGPLTSTSTGTTGSSSLPTGGASSVASTLGTTAAGAATSVPSTVGGAVASRTPITIGFQWVDTSQGAGGIDPQNKLSLGSPVQQAKVMVASLNAHGGIAGHPVKLVTHAIPYLNLFTNASVEYQTTCTAFTQDVHVQVAILNTNDPALVSCLSNKGVPSVSDAYVVPKSQYSQRYWSPNSASYERGHVGMVNGLAARGFFTGAKVGIMYTGTQVFAPVEKAVKKALAARGIPVAAEFASAGTNAGAMANDASSAVLKFRAAGVSHVIFIDLGGGLSYLFMNAAQSQSYTPKYALSSANNLVALQTLGQPRQLANAAAFGWVPGEAASEQPKVARGWNATGTRCYQVMTKAGLDMSGSAGGTAMLTCDMFLAVSSAGEASHDPSPAGLLRGVDALGTSFQSTASLGTRLGPDRHDGASASRFLSWGSSCSCWVSNGAGPAF